MIYVIYSNIPFELPLNPPYTNQEQISQKVALLLTNEIKQQYWYTFFS